MVVRKRTQLQKRRYLAAFIISCLIFSLGFMGGIVLDGKRAGYLESVAESQRVDYGSVQLQYQLIEEIRQDGDCAALRSTFSQNIENLEKPRIRLETFQQDSASNKEQYDLLAREYTHAQIRYYLLAQSIQDLCGGEIATILFFYDKDCPQCDNQAFILTYLKTLIDDKVLIFSFNRVLAEQEPTIQLLMNRYQVRQFPSIVVNEELSEGLQSREKILGQLCGWYEQQHAFCK